MALIEVVFTRQSPLAGAGLFAWFVFCCMTQHFLEVHLEFEKEIVIRRRLVGKKRTRCVIWEIGRQLGCEKSEEIWQAGSHGQPGVGGAAEDLAHLSP